MLNKEDTLVVLEHNTCPDTTDIVRQPARQPLKLQYQQLFRITSPE